MSQQYYFFVEHRGQENWLCLPEFVEKGKSHSFAKPIFTIPYKSPQAKLFFSEDALIEMHQGIPLSPLSEEVLFRVDGKNASIWWISFDEMMFEDWVNSFVLVSAEVERHYVDCFGDGQDLFPEDALRKKGMDKDDITALKHYTSAIVLADSPINGGYELLSNFDKKTFEVTWKKSIADLVGVEIIEKINTVIGKYSSDKIRFIVGWG